MLLTLPYQPDWSIFEWGKYRRGLVIVPSRDSVSSAGSRRLKDLATFSSGNPASGRDESVTLRSYHVVLYEDAPGAYLTLVIRGVGVPVRA